MSGSSSSVLRNLKELIHNQEENLRKAIEDSSGQRSASDHVDSFDNGDDFIPDDRSTPVHHASQPCHELPTIPEYSEPEMNNSINGMNRSVFMEDSPVKPGVDGRKVKSFEELLELSMREESLQANQINTDVSKPIIKRPFLKKGTGIEARFKPKQVVKRTCQKQCNKDDVTKPQVSRKIMNVKAVNILPRTDTKSPQPKKTAMVTGNPLNLQKPNGQLKKGSKIPDTSLDNLERLLESVRSKKEELLRQPLSSSSSSEEDSCWEDEDDMEDSEPEQMPRYHKKKSVRWNDDSPSKMSKAKVGVYSKSVQNYMASLEDKLSELQDKCASKMMVHKEKQRPKSTEISEDITKEIAELRSQISVIADGVKTLQLFTSNLRASEETRKRPQNDRTKVKITREAPLKDHSSRSNSVTPSCHEEDTNVKFGNGDQMQVLNDGTVIYTFSDGTLQTTFPDGSKVVQFKNGQIERTLVNGLRHITYPNKCQRTINPDGSEELIMADGTMTRIAVDGTEVMILPNGEREIRSKQYSRREYKNGSVKTIYADGTQETRFPNGRLRIKDKNDKILVDSVVRPLTHL